MFNAVYSFLFVTSHPHSIYSFHISFFVGGLPAPAPPADYFTSKTPTKGDRVKIQTSYIFWTIAWYKWEEETGRLRKAVMKIVNVRGGDRAGKPISFWEQLPARSGAEKDVSSSRSQLIGLQNIITSYYYSKFTSYIKLSFFVS